MKTISEALETSGFETIDFIILIIYICLLIVLGLFLSRNKDGKEKTANDYFLAGNTLTWWAVGASLIAANISAEQFIGMSGTGFRDGIAIAAYEVMAALALVVIGKFLLPVMLDRKIFTIPQFLRERYNDGVGLAFSILWLFLYVFVNLTSVAWLGAIAIEQILGLQGMSVEILGFTISIRMLIILMLFIVAGVYSIYGGLASVAWTDVMQVTFLVGGGLITAYVALKEMGNVMGVNPLGALGRIYTDLTTGAHATDVHFHLVIQQSHNPEAFANVPGIAAVVGGVWLTNLGYWGFNQYIIQKGLAAKSVDEAKKGLIFAGFLKILIPFIVVLPGICAYYIAQDPQYFANMHLAGKINVADDAYPWLIRNFTPTGIKGLSFAALTAAIISSCINVQFNVNIVHDGHLQEICQQECQRPQACQCRPNCFSCCSTNSPCSSKAAAWRLGPGFPVHTRVFRFHLSGNHHSVRTWSSLEACIFKGSYLDSNTDHTYRCSLQGMSS